VDTAGGRPAKRRKAARPASRNEEDGADEEAAEVTGEEGEDNHGSEEDSTDDAGLDDDEDEEDEDASSDDSEDDAPRNRIGNVPLEWYKDEDHVGYDLAGERIRKTLSTGEIDALLENADNPDAWRTLKDHKNQREITLTDTDLEVIRRIRDRMYPSGHTNTMEMVEYENKDAKIHPMSSAHPPKRRFLPSKWERMKVKKLVALLREGKILPPPPPAPEVWDLWADDAPSRRKAPRPLPAPKLALPGHAESYNPPTEYLLTEEEKKEWEEQDPSERALTHLPQKHDCLRKVPSYPEFIVERFSRCLDLYLVPRALRNRMNVDPDSLLPKLPSPKELRPFPTHVAVAYEGHQGLVRSVAVDPAGQWIATVSEDKTMRIWEVASGRQTRCIEFPEAAMAVSWCPQYALLAVSADEVVYFVDPDLEPGPPPQELEESKGEDGDREGNNAVGKGAVEADKRTVASLLKFNAALQKAEEKGETEESAEKTAGAKARAVQWKAVPEDSALYKAGCRLSIATDGDVQTLTWHHKGNYCAAVSPKAKAPSNQCIIHGLFHQKSMRPFAKLKGGQVQACAFHPNKPHFFVATKLSVRVYDLQKQVQLRQLISGAKWISSISVHPDGDHVVVGSYDRRVIWFDLDFASKPYKTMQYHDRAVRRATFHPGKYPLMACASDDGTVSVMHAKVYSDLMKNPLIVPVKRLKGEHRIREGLGVLDCTWHPNQPWIFTSGADKKVLLWA